MTRPERLARGGVISLFGSAFAALSALVLTAVVGRLLGADGTGIFFQAVGIFTILTQVLRLGTNSGIVRFIAEQRAFDRRGSEWLIVVYATIPVAALSGIVSILILLYSSELAAVLTSTHDQAELAKLLVAMTPFLLAASLLGVFQISARMLRGVGTFTLLQSVLLPASRLVTVLMVAFAGASAWTAFQAWLSPLAAWLLVTAVVIASPLVRDFLRRSETSRAEKPTMRSFWRFNAPRSVSSSLEVALEWSDVLIVVALASPAVGGIYAVVTRAVRAGGIVDKAMRVAVSPTISGLIARGRLTRTSSLHTSVVRAMILLNWPFYLLLVSMGGSVLLLFGSEFQRGWGPMALLAAASMFQTAAGMLQSILLQGGRSTWQMYNKLLALALSIGGNVLLVPHFGIWGAAITWALVMLVDNVLAGFQVHRLMGVKLNPGKLFPATVVPAVVFGAGGAMFSLLFGSSIALLLIAGVWLTFLYGLALWLLRRPLQIVQLWRKLPFIGPWA